MAQLPRDRYHTYQVGPHPRCRAIAAAFHEHCAPRSASLYLLFLEEDADRLLKDIRPFGMAMFSNDIFESLNMFLKQGFNEHSARGGGKKKATGQTTSGQKATGQTASGRPEASIESEAGALGQVLQWVVQYFHIHLHQDSVGRDVPCVPTASPESVPHSPPSFLSSLLSCDPEHGHTRQRPYTGHVHPPVAGNTKHAGGCVCMHACEFVHHASYAACDVCIMAWP